VRGRCIVTVHGPEVVFKRKNRQRHLETGILEGDDMRPSAEHLSSPKGAELKT